MQYNCIYNCEDIIPDNDAVESVTNILQPIKLLHYADWFELLALFQINCIFSFVSMHAFVATVRC